MSHLRITRPRPISLPLLVGVIGLLLTISALFISEREYGSFKGSLVNVDPTVVEEIVSGSRVTCYAVAKPDEVQYLPVPIKAWRFGDHLILKYTVSSREQLYAISRHSIYVSGIKTVKIIDPIGIIKKSVKFELMNDLKYAKEYAGDVKRDFHRASRRWTGKGVVACVIDSGVDYLHPDLKPNVMALVSMYVYGNNHPLVWIAGVNGTLEEAWEYEQLINATYMVLPWMDKFGHGTHVSGTIAGTGDASGGSIKGLAPDAKIVSIKAFTDNGTASVDIILDALDWVQKYGKLFNITIINMSFGSFGANDGRDPISIACDELADEGYILFASAGNNYAFPFTIAIPACARKVIAIGAINPYKGTIPTWSSMGTTKDGRMKPDFLCAGVWILAPKPVTVKSYLEEVMPEAVKDKYYMWLSGTSMSCAVASGIACEWAEWYIYVFHEEPSWRAIYSYFKRYAVKINPLFKDFISGEGIPLAPE